MRFTLASRLRATACVIILGATLVVSTTQKHPTFTKIFDATLIKEELFTEVGHLGQRLLLGFGGGNLTDSATGNVVATFLPGLGGEFGLMGGNNIFYPDVRAMGSFVDDSALFFLDMRGVSDLSIAHNHVYLETNSSKYDYLGRKFLYLSADILANPFTMSIYQLDN